MSSHSSAFVSIPFRTGPSKLWTNSNTNSHSVRRVKVRAVIPSRKQRESNIPNSKEPNVEEGGIVESLEKLEDDNIVPDETELKQQHLNAYFSADDSSYQPKLSSAPKLAFRNFMVELEELKLAARRTLGLNPPLQFTPPDVLNFKLSSEAVARRESERVEKEGGQKTSWFVTFVYKIMCSFLDIRFEGRPIPRFWFLETVARMPYFSYTSCLHLFSTLGWFRSPTLMNMHHAEELNEAYHLAVMESLGGDKRWGDRFLAFHASLIYYWCLVILFFISPTESYRFSELIEGHAVDTYAEFIDANREILKSLPVPDVAYEYYSNFMYYFYEFQLSSQKQPTGSASCRRPQINSLLDVFQNILLDELEHTRTMGACMNFIEKGEKIWFNGNCVSADARTVTVIPRREREAFWKNWSILREKKDEENSD